MREYGKLGIRKQKGTGKLIGYMYYYDEQGERKQISHTAKSLKKREAEKELRTWELGGFKRSSHLMLHPLTIL